MLQCPRMNRTSVLALIAEFGPLLLFFIAGRVTDFFNAVIVLMVSTAAAVVLSWHLDRRIPWLPVISACFVLIGGFITVHWRAPDAVIFADTLYYASVALAILIPLLRGTLLLKVLFGTVFALSDDGWRVLSWHWFWFLLAASIANEIARFYLTPVAWIDYRLYKSLLVTLFALSQFTVSVRYRIPEESNRFGLRIK
jgi:intracellular septation protein